MNKYTVTFVDEDGTEILSGKYDYGTASESITLPSDPTKAATAQYTYTFAWWSPEITGVVGDATYTATYDSTELINILLHSKMRTEQKYQKCWLWLWNSIFEIL